MADLTAADILAADDMGLVPVNVKEWNGTVYVRVMSVGEMEAYQREFAEKKEKMENWRAKLLQRCLCDKSGRQLFTPEEIDKLSAKSVKVMSKLFDAAMKHNAVTEKDVEDLAKN
jgi:monomeric isocitrate dehydrogenase